MCVTNGTPIITRNFPRSELPSETPCNNEIIEGRIGRKSHLLRLHASKNNFLCHKSLWNATPNCRVAPSTKYGRADFATFLESGEHEQRFQARTRGRDAP